MNSKQFQLLTSYQQICRGNVLSTDTIKTMFKEEKKLPLYQWPTATEKNQPVINLRHEAWKKDGFFQESQEFWCVGCCKLKPGPGCQRAKGWCHRVVLGDKNRNYKCWKSQTGACVESPVTPPLCFTLWGTWLTGSQVWAKTLLSNIWAPRAPDLLAGKDIWMCPPHPSTLTLYSTSKSPVAWVQTLNWSL